MEARLIITSKASEVIVVSVLKDGRVTDGRGGPAHDQVVSVTCGGRINRELAGPCRADEYQVACNGVVVAVDADGVTGRIIPAIHQARPIRNPIHLRFDALPG